MHVNEQDHINRVSEIMRATLPVWLDFDPPGQADAHDRYAFIFKYDGKRRRVEFSDVLIEDDDRQVQLKLEVRRIALELARRRARRGEVDTPNRADWP
jgi:hypothetical protein